MIAKGGPLAAARLAARANARVLAGVAGIAAGSVLLGSAVSFRRDAEPTYFAENGELELRDAARSQPNPVSPVSGLPAASSMLIQPEPRLPARPASIRAEAAAPARAAGRRALPVTLDRTVTLGDLDRFRAPFDGGGPPSARALAAGPRSAAVPMDRRAVSYARRGSAGAPPLASSRYGAGLQGYSTGTEASAQREAAKERGDHAPRQDPDAEHSFRPRAGRVPARDDDNHDDDSPAANAKASSSEEQQGGSPGGDVIGEGGALVSEASSITEGAGLPGSSQSMFAAATPRTYGNGTFTRPKASQTPPVLPHNLESPPQAQFKALIPGGFDWSRPQAASIPGFSNAERLAACGLIAAEALERYLYRDARLDRIAEIRRVARASNLWTLDGMRGPASEQRLLHLIGIEAGLLWLNIDLRGSSLEEIAQRSDVQQVKQTLIDALAKGRPVIVATLAHYYFVQGYSNGMFFVGHTGRVMSWRDPQAADQMTLERILKDGTIANGLIIPNAARLTP